MRETGVKKFHSLLNSSLDEDCTLAACSGSLHQPTENTIPDIQIMAYHSPDVDCLTIKPLQISIFSKLCFLLLLLNFCLSAFLVHCFHISFGLAGIFLLF
jgi:hypothetical protein